MAIMNHPENSLMFFGRSHRVHCVYVLRYFWGLTRWWRLTLTPAQVILRFLH